MTMEPKKGRDVLATMLGDLSVALRNEPVAFAADLVSRATHVEVRADGEDAAEIHYYLMKGDEVLGYQSCASPWNVPAELVDSE